MVPGENPGIFVLCFIINLFVMDISEYSASLFFYRESRHFYIISFWRLNFICDIGDSGYRVGCSSQRAIAIASCAGCVHGWKTSAFPLSGPR